MSDRTPDDHTPSDGSEEWIEGDSTQFQDVIEKILAECFELPENQWEQAVAKQCQAHPDDAERIRRRFDMLRLSGLLGSQDPTTGNIPDRLGDYRLIRKIGGGGMGVVYLAEQESLGREVALKLVRPDQMYFPRVRKRFQREVKAIASLHHPGIVAIHAVGEADGTPYFAMEKIEGCTLAEALTELGDRDPTKLRGAELQTALEARAISASPHDELAKGFSGSWQHTCVKLIRQVCEALQHAHDREVLHRDIKPSNIMVTTEGRALLFDFGLARTSGTSRLTRTGVTVGSLPYMSPEQVRSRGEIDVRSDVYSLGVTLYELLTLESPFMGEDSDSTRELVLTGHPEPIRRINPSVSRDVELVCLAAMDRDPERRYESAEAFGRDLENALKGRPIEARKAGPVTQARRWVERHPILTALTILLGLQIIVAQGVMTFGGSDVKSEQVEAALLEARLARQHGRQLEYLIELENLIDEAPKPPSLVPAVMPSLDDWLNEAAKLLERRASLEQDLGTLDSVKSSTLLEQLERLEVLRSQIEKNRDRIREIQWQSVESPEARAAWEEAREAIFLSDVYELLEMRPQYGLYPLAENPETGLWEFWHVPSGDMPQRRTKVKDPDRLVWDVTPTTGIVLVLIPGQTFHMGAQKPPSDRPDGPLNFDVYATEFEGPVHKVTLDAFFLSKYELTQAQWSRDAHDVEFPSTAMLSEKASSYELLPVESVSWKEALEWLSRNNLTLPTEAQWECAARAETRTVFSSGLTDESLKDHANLADRAYHKYIATLKQEPTLFDGHSRTAMVGEFYPNGYGLHDVHGNVAEMCLDGAFAYGERPARIGDGYRGEASEENWPAVRGGAWTKPPKLARSAARETVAPHTRVNWVGIRPAYRLILE